LKTVLITSLTILFCFKAAAQSNYNKLSIGAGGGLTQSFTDIGSNDFAPAAYGNVEYFMTPFLSLGSELQVGKIKAGNPDTDPHGRAFVNSYKALKFGGKVYLGAVTDFERSTFLNAVKWAYLGLQGGIVSNTMTSIERVQKRTGYRFPGKNASKDLDLALDLGISFYFPDREGKPRFAINANYQTNVTIGEGLDGYDDSPIKFKNGNPDMYNYYSIGLKYHIGILDISKRRLYR